MVNLYVDYEDMLGKYQSCENCYEMHCIKQCLLSYTCLHTLNLLRFRKYLKCRKQVIDKNDEEYMLVGDFVPYNWDEDIKLLEDGPLLLNENVLAKYFKEIWG